MERSWHAGAVRELPAQTIADGIAVTSPFPEALSDITGVVDDILLVDDGAIVSAIRRAYADLGIVLEPAGAAGLAAVMANRDRFRGRLVVTVLSGGNATTDQLRQWL
jgi:threonine dehydratase